MLIDSSPYDSDSDGEDAVAPPSTASPPGGAEQSAAPTGVRKSTVIKSGQCWHPNSFEYLLPPPTHPPTTGYWRFFRIWSIPEHSERLENPKPGQNRLIFH